MPRSLGAPAHVQHRHRLVAEPHGLSLDALEGSRREGPGIVDDQPTGVDRRGSHPPHGVREEDDETGQRLVALQDQRAARGAPDLGGRRPLLVGERVDGEADTALGIGDSIAAKDLNLPEGAVFPGEPDDLMLSVTAAKTQEQIDAELDAAVAGDEGEAPAEAEAEAEAAESE